MTDHPNIPAGLTLTGRPLLLYPSIIPELQQRLSHAYSQKATKLADRLMRRAPQTPTPAATHSATSRLSLSDAPAPAPTQNYIAVIHVEGPLLNKANYFGDTLCIDGYDRIEADLDAAFGDPSCGGILLDIDSPGGMVNGCFELSDKIKAYAQTKPIITHTPALLCSAAYALASGSTEIYSDLTCYVGSIGVVYGRYDYSNANEKFGLKITHITSGDRKAWGDPDTALSDGELSSRQGEINLLAGMFFDRVSAGRGLSVEAINDLQAGTFLPDDALSHGLIDQVASRQAALARLAEIIADPSAATPKSSPTPSPSTESDTSAAAAAQPSTPKTKESDMSNLKAARARATLTATLSTVAFAMAMNMSAASDLNDDDLNAAVEEETKTRVEDMDDEEVEALNDDEEVEALEEEDDENITAESEDDMDEAEKDDEDVTAKATASRIAYAAVNGLGTKPKASKNTRRKKTADADRGTVNATTLRDIMGLKSAKGREALASNLAASGMSVEDADVALKSSPKPGATASQTALSNIPSPKVGTGGKSAAADAKGSPLDQAISNVQAKKAGRKPQ